MKPSFQALRPRTFGNRLLFTLVIMLVGMVTLHTLLVAAMVKRGVLVAEADERVALAENYASQSVFGLLVAADDREVARSLATQFADAPGISYAALLDTTNRVVAEAGSTPRALPDTLPSGSSILEFNDAWRIFAEVRTTPEDGFEGEVVGRLVIDASKENVNALIRRLTIVSTGGLAAIAIALAGWISLRVASITRPLRKASATLRTGDIVELSPSPDDPEEFQTLAEGFNTLLRQLELERSALERTVEERTSALMEALAAAEHADLERRNFSAAVTHEMKTPLNAMSLRLHRALHDLEFAPASAADPVRASLADVLRQKDDLLHRINDILTLSRREDDGSSLSPEATELRHVAESLKVSIRDLADQNENELHIAWSGEQVIYIDRQKLQHIALNLLTNACKFTRRGEVVCQLDADMERLRLEVRDTGIGIDEEIRSHLFSPFTQGDVLIATKYGGTGLGLALVKALVDSMDGEISVDSTVGEGTVFVASLPYSPVPPTSSTDDGG